MIAVEAARALLARNLWHPSTMDVPLRAALDAILAAPLRADRPQPAYTRVMMDGYAGCFEALASSTRGTFPVRGMQRAGAPASLLETADALLEVATGAVLPGGRADTVIPYENTEKDPAGGGVRVVVPPARRGEFVHPAGSDAREGDVLVAQGARVGAPEFAIACTVGAVTLRVRALPRVAVLGTGDEVVPPEERPAPHQIRASNAPMIAAVLTGRGVGVEVGHASDDEASLGTALATALESHDLLLLSGGVSRGRADLVPAVLASLGVETLFHRVAQRPGKPLFFGRRRNTFVFGLPGNPNSALMCLTCYVIPWILASRGAGEGAGLLERVSLERPVKGNPELDQFLGAAIVHDARGPTARVVAPANSGDAAGLVGARGFVRVPAGRDVEAGCPVEFFSWEGTL